MIVTSLTMQKAVVVKRVAAFCMVEREGFEPKCEYDGKTLNSAEKLATTTRRDKNVNTRKIAGKNSN